MEMQPRGANERGRRTVIAWTLNPPRWLAVFSGGVSVRVCMEVCVYIRVSFVAAGFPSAAVVVVISGDRKLYRLLVLYYYSLQWWWSSQKAPKFHRPVTHPLQRRRLQTSGERVVVYPTASPVQK